MRALTAPVAAWPSKRRLPIVCRDHNPGLRGRVQDGANDLRAGNAVDGGMVHLGNQREGALGQAGNSVEALDEIEFPERPRAIQPAGKQVGGHCHQLCPAPGGDQPAPGQVQVEVEIGIIHPARMRQAERHLHQPLPEDTRAIQARRNVRPERLEAETCGRVRSVQHVHAAHMHGAVFRFEVDERRVQR
jgi:hypothetical protein